MDIRIPVNDNNLNFGLGKFAFSLLPLSPESTGRRKTILTEGKVCCLLLCVSTYKCRRIDVLRAVNKTKNLRERNNKDIRPSIYLLTVA